jgi:predicted molibdopterin-dependent oxidoreductase YjgC
MTNSIEDLAKARAFFVIGSNTTEQHPVIGAAVKRAVRKGAKLIVADPRGIELARIATLHLAQSPGSDIALLNGLCHVIIREDLHDKTFVAERTEGYDQMKAAVETYTPARVQEITGISAEDIEKAARLYAQSKPAAILYSMGITQHASGHATVMAIANLAMLCGNIGVEGGGVNPLRGQNNVQGACDMGGLPDVFPGYRKVADPEARAAVGKAWGATLSDKPGLTVVEMMNAAHEGKIKAIFIMGENPLVTDPNLHHVEEALKNLDFLIIQDIFFTETATLADVVLPGAAFAEKDGTFSNTERRVQLVRKAVEPPGDAKPDWRIICELAMRLTGDKAPICGYQSRQTGKGRHPMALSVGGSSGNEDPAHGKIQSRLGKVQRSGKHTARRTVRYRLPLDVDHWTPFAALSFRIHDPSRRGSQYPAARGAHGDQSRRRLSP